MADLNDLKDRVNLLDYIKATGKYTVIPLNGNQCRLNPCPFCEKKDHFTYYYDTNTYNSFSGCCKGGSIIDFLQEYEHLDIKEAINKLYSLTGTEKDKYTPPAKKEIPTNKETTKGVEKEMAEEKQEELNQQIEENQNQLRIVKENGNQTNAINYLESRNLKSTLCWEYNISEYGGFVYIPLSEKGEEVAYVSRAINPVGDFRYKNSKGKIRLFNSRYLTEETEGKKVLFICEGIFDALSFESVGEKAIALNSVNNIKLLLQTIKENKKISSTYTYLVALDNDSAGEKGVEELTQGLEELKLPYQVLNIPEKYNDQPVKDVNDLYKAIKDDNIFKAQFDILFPTTTQAYLMEQFQADINQMATYKTKSTGFPVLDSLLNGIYPGLYTLGAISSLGKTTFVSQLTDQMARKGEKVLFFSLEQSKFEMTAKSLSRQMFLVNPRQGKTSLQIMKNENDVLLSDDFSKALNNYNDIAKNTTVIEGNFDTDINDIAREIKKYIELSGIKPVVVIDYLQIIRPAEEHQRLTERQQIDIVVSTLKQLSRNHNIPIIVISSLNRENYKNTIDFSSFKESGGIEYSSDVVLGLQLASIEEISLMKNETDKRIKLNEEKSKDIRRIELVCLKNRNGRSFFKDKFSYYSAFNYFVEEGEE